MAEDERTRRIERDEDDQELTRRLAVYEEQDHTQRLRVPPTPPWDSADVAPLEPNWAPDGERRRGGWPTALVVAFALLGLLVGVLGTLVVTNGAQGDVQALEAQLASARQAVADRDARIGELEGQLEDARSTSFPGLPGIEFPPGFELPNIPLPDDEQSRELAEEIERRIRDFIDSR